jgi:hypothetical protein
VFLTALCAAAKSTGESSPAGPASAQRLSRQHETDFEQTGDEMHVATKPVELQDDDGALGFPGCLTSGGEPRAAIEGIRPLAGRDLGFFLLARESGPRCRAAPWSTGK